MEKQSNKHPSFYILSTLFILDLIFIILGYCLDFSSNSFYQSLSFSILVVDIFLSFILVVVEFLSLRFDRTASKETLYSTIFLFVSFFFSKDTFYAYDTLGWGYGDILPKIYVSINQLCLLGYVFFTFLFYQNNYQTKKYHFIHLFSFIFGIILTIIFSIFDLYYGLLVVSIIVVIYVLYFLIRYLIQTKNKPDYLVALYVGVIIFVISTMIIMNVLATYNPKLIGATSIIAAITMISYIFIYLDFVLKHTRAHYQFEDKEKEINEKKSHKMKVTCFHTFGALYDDIPLKFPSKKAKELFALLIVLNGPSLTMDKAITYLWPDKDVDKAKTLYRNTIMKLRDYFKEIKCNILTFKRGEIFIDTSIVECDYYDVIAHKNPYDGSPLLPEYDWSLEFENIFK